MSLREYVRKRNFDKTPEPAPSEAAPSDGKPSEESFGRFYIQRHDATRLHYDFRLEISGTLKSWAVPKGPSLVPLSKSLAMHVEDHPLDYGEFEGNIPKGNYGGGSVMLWDKGTFDLLGTGLAEEQIARGDLKIRLHGTKVNGEYAIVLMKGRGKGNEWLLIKKRDEFADEKWDVEAHAYSVKTGRTQEEIAQDLPAHDDAAKAKTRRVAKSPKSKPSASNQLTPAELPGARKAAMPQSISPMTAFSETTPPAGPNWIYEIKWDGVRAICFIEQGRIHMCSRKGNAFDRQYPELGVVPHQVAAETAIIDGEIAILDQNGRSSFELIQPRIHQTDANSIAHLARKSPARLFAFDLIYWDGYDLRNTPLSERKRALAAILTPNDQVRISEHFTVQGEQMLEAARQMGLEGILAKQADSKYEDKRSRCWLKIKITSRQEFVICGYTHGERDTFGSLVLGVYDEGKLTWAGNAGTGFDDRTLRDLHGRLKALEIPKCPFGKVPAMLRTATWAEPTLVCECRFLEWTKDGKLRAPVFLGLRTDKDPKDVVREQPLAEAHRPDTLPDTPVKEPEAETSHAEGTPLLPPTAKELTTRIGGHPLKFTNLDKIWYPKEKYTKRDVLNYYDAVAHLLVPHLKDRPLSLKRYPGGIHQDFFFQKNIPEGYPAWLRIEPIPSEHRGEDIRFVVADDRPTLLYLTNLGCIDQNPWMSRVQSLQYPDYVLIDLDPVECGFGKIVEAMLLVRKVLDDLKLEGYPKTTGGDGMHVFIPIEPRYTFDQARSFAEIVSQLVLAENPDLFTTPRSVEKRRKNRVYFDYMQIGTGKTIAAPYVLRAYDGAPVATPLRWEEVKTGLTPHDFHIGNAVDRFRETGDLFEAVLTKPQKLEPALKRMAKLLGSG
ncbi:MAG: DNA ligase D [Bryobacteraceae bacterium]|nr:DNA ligase D [Bryobacteraceae bacterium]